MAAKLYYGSNQFYEQDQQRLLSSPDFSSSGQPSPLEPLHFILGQSSLHQHAPYEESEQLKTAAVDDAQLKALIRRLRVISRVLALLISIAVLIPITMVVMKFLSTKDAFRPVTQNGRTISRTAWAKDTKEWPTFMYFAVAALSVVLNVLTIFSYKWGVEKANAANSFATWVIMMAHCFTWSVAAALYRIEKDKNGKSNDLWGWSCSGTADALQREFEGLVNFDQLCTMQSVSWYTGLAQAGAALLTMVIYVFVLLRRSSKRKLKQHIQLSGYEPSRRSSRHQEVGIRSVAGLNFRSKLEGEMP